MSKIVAPPQITKIGELIELLLDPKKYADYLMQLKQLHDAVDERVSTYNLASGIEAAQREADENLAKTAQALLSAKAKAEAMAEEAENVRDAANDMYEEAKKALADAKHEMDQAISFSRQEENKMEIREEAVASREEAMDRRAKELESRERAVVESENKIKERLRLMNQPL